MRTIGILAIFFLSLAAIVQGAYTFKLSRQVKQLSQERETAREESAAVARDENAPAAVVDTGGSAVFQRRPVQLPTPSVPSFSPPPTTNAASTVLHDVLGTPEGRQQLRAALDVIAEEKHQERLWKQATKHEEREMRFRDRVLKAVPLTGDEPLRVAKLFTDLQTGRQQILEDMRAGNKTADQADSAIDELRDANEKAVHALLGDERWKKARKDDKRQEDRGGTPTPQSSVGGGGGGVGVAASAPSR